MPSPPLKQFQQRPAPVRQFLVAPGKVSVFDGLLPEDELVQYCAGVACAAFTRTELATPATPDHRHFVSEMPLPTLTQLPILARTYAALDAHIGAVRFRAYRAYTNFAAFGDMLFSHTDCAPGAGELTALWFLCERWDPEWGGETVFLDASGEALGLVSPKPGRLVVFDGDIRHAGRPPSRLCTAPRYTFAIKFERQR